MFNALGLAAFERSSTSTVIEEVGQAPYPGRARRRSAHCRKPRPAEGHTEYMRR